MREALSHKLDMKQMNVTIFVTSHFFNQVKHEPLEVKSLKIKVEFKQQKIANSS
jgi:hypothetical protein